MNKISGLIAPSITVFKENEDLDYDATLKHIKYLFDSKMDAVVIGGSSGELPALTWDETKNLFTKVTDAFKENIYLTTGRYSTRQTVELSQLAEKLGAVGLMIPCPYYLLPNTEAIVSHFEKVREATTLPIILYNNPAVCGVELPLPAIKRLAENGTIQAVKSSQGNPYVVRQVRDACGDKVSSLYGHDYAAPEAMGGGAFGWLSGILNVFPKLCKELWNSDSYGAFNYSFIFMPFTNFALTGDPHLVSCYKAALQIQGYPVGNPRLPLKPLTEQQMVELEAIVQKIIK